VCVVLLVPAVGLGDGAIEGTSGDDVLVGTPRSDSIFGLAGNDRIDGAAGDDDLDGGPGADDMHGGSGVDSALYGGRSAPVAVTLDNVADDGEAGEKDNVHSDVEQLFGGAAGDRLSGGAGPELIDGGAGDDVIDDGGGTDRVYGGDGNDALTTFDGATDIVVCGPGIDTATADASDVLSGCEKRLSGPRVRAHVEFTFAFEGPRTSFSQLVVRGSLAGTDVQLRCRGAGCPAGTRINAKTGQSRVSLTSRMRRRQLRAGARLDVLVGSPQKIGRVERWLIRDGSAPKHSLLCLAPGSHTPQSRC
jgi:hypothetical protein